MRYWPGRLALPIAGLLCFAGLVLWLFAQSGALSAKDPFLRAFGKVAAGGREDDMVKEEFFDLYRSENNLTWQREWRSSLPTRLPVGHWRTRKKPMMPLALETLNRPGVGWLLVLLYETGEFGDDEDSVSLWTWWRELPLENARGFSYYVMGIIARSKSKRAAEIVWAETKGRCPDVAWIWVREVDPQYIPLDPEQILKTGTPRECYRAANVLIGWGNRGPATRALCERALKEATSSGDTNLAIMAERLARKISEP